MTVTQSAVILAGVILAIGNQKGGVGKTTTALNLAAALATRGRRVLAIDLDPQSSLTISAGLEDCAGRSMAEVIAGQLALTAILRKVRPGLLIAPSDIALAEAEIIMVGKIGREWALRKALLPALAGYDYVLLDLPPSLSILTINGLATADRVLVPAIPQFLDMRALGIFTKTIDLVRQELNPGLVLWGVLPTFYDSRLKLHAEVLQAWELAGLPLLPLRVRRSVRVAEAPIGGQSLAEYSPDQAKVYSDLAELIDNANEKTRS